MKSKHFFYDSKEQPTAFTDVNFSEMDGDGMSLYNDTSFAHPRNFSVNNRQSDELRRSAIKNSVGLQKRGFIFSKKVETENFLTINAMFLSGGSFH